MLRARADRHIATAFFVDVVDSTRIAATLGDRRWRELLAAFRDIVRGHLRRNGGREVDTAGDGLFATFSSPAGALRAAARIITDVQTRGLDVRCGLHTGELQRMEGQPGGLAAHIAARVMAQAKGAEILATGTVHDLVVGGAATFESVGDFELKGVPGRWMLYRVTAFDGRPIPAPLEADEAATLRTQEVQVRSRVRLAAAGGGGILAAAAILGVVQLTRPPAVPGGSPTPSPLPPVALMKLDPLTMEFVATVRDVSLPTLGGSVEVADGALWYVTTETLDRRDLATGDVLMSIDLPPETWKTAVAFGKIWIAHGKDELPNRLSTLIDQHNAVTGRAVEQIDPGRALWDFTVGDEALYLLARGSKILELDPRSNDIVDRDPAGTETQPMYISYHDGHLWLCECPAQRSAEFDPNTDTVISTITGDPLGPGAVDPLTGIGWIADRLQRTLTPFNLTTRELEASIGLKGIPRGFTFGFGAIWLAAEEYVYRIDSSTRRASEIAVPEGVTATGVGIDEETRTIWISTCAVDCDDYEV